MTTAPIVDHVDLLAYLQNTGWRLHDDPASRFIVFSSPQSESIEVGLLRNQQAREQTIYQTNAIQILANLSDSTPEQIEIDINQVNRDALRIRVLNAGIDDAIPLRTAAQQVNQLKQLVAYAACSEIDQRPFYLTAQRPEARQAIESYRFGHTFKGSFGFTIETPRILEINNYAQLSLLPDLVKDHTNIPVFRKIMERIARGLVYTRQATETRDPNLLIDSYQTALNANMCQALAALSQDKSLQVEFTVHWATIKIPDDPEIRNPGPILLTEPAYNQLEYAADQLSVLEPQEVTLTANVIELSAKDSPLALDTSRTIRLRWFDTSEGKTFEATATLSSEHYQLAIEAHKAWHPVQIKGELRTDKRNWRFITYTAFDLT